MISDVERAHEKNPSIPLLDLHFYGMKGFGIKDRGISEGRPKFHIMDSEKLFSFVPLISSQSSPYVFNNDSLSYNSESLPFRVKHIGRIVRNPSYFYYRGIQEWMPTLDSETILSINFQPICRGCEWCCRVIGKGMRNLSPEEGVHLMKKGDVNFSSVDKLAFVTGMYRDGEDAVNNLLKTVNLIKDEGFDGRVLYIGSQIQSDQIGKLMDGLENTPLKYAYTLETFTQREKMHRKKTYSLEEALHSLEDLRSSGVTDLEYSYMPGIDPLDKFYEWMPKFSRLAKPHLSIFRPAEDVQESFKDPGFSKDPIGYLCSMRSAFEKEHGGPIYQNNLASLWGFPLNRINPLFLTEKTSL